MRDAYLGSYVNPGLTEVSMGHALLPPVHGRVTPLQRYEPHEVKGHFQGGMK